MYPHRLPIIDGFRFIALIVVLVYHLTNPYTVHYPHTDFFLHIFNLGYLGVYFFFIISGFVINYTLDNTATIGSFFRNRFARLFPAMLLCSVVTFFTAQLLVSTPQFAEAKVLRNMLPGLTFTNPAIWTVVLSKPFHWINGSYWTLWVEVQFYLVVAVIYYAHKGRFLRNFLVVSIIISTIVFVPNFAQGHPIIVNNSRLNQLFNTWRWLTEAFNLTFNIGWFCCGVFFYQLFKGVKVRPGKFSTIGFAAVSLLLIRNIFDFYANYWIMLIALLVMCMLFLLMIYKKSILSLLENRLVTRIGKTSYSSYLIHEVAGILLINTYSGYMGALNWLSPMIIILLTLIFAELSYRFYETRVATIVKRKFSS